MNRVVITGLGVVSPVGCSLSDFWTALVNGRTGIGQIKNIPTTILKNTIAAEVKNFDPDAHFDPKRVGMLDRFSQFAVVAARSAISDAGLELNEALRNRIATLIGTGAGGQTTIDDAYLKLYGEHSLKVHPFIVPRLMPSAAASQVSMDLKLRGPTLAISTACASGTHAIGYAFYMIRSGQCPVVLAGGAEASLAVGPLKAWEALRILSYDTCRPFSKNRSGLVLGEGAAILVLENLDHAKRRGAPIYAEIRGFGMSADAHDLISPDVDGASRAIRHALEDAQLSSDAIDYVNAHGTGTKLNDRTETQVLKTVFGAHAGKLAISSNKAVLGHGLGCAGAFEAATTALTLKTQTVTPTANYQEADAECDLDYVPNIARNMPVETAISNSFAFGGLNAVLAMSKFQ